MFTTIHKSYVYSLSCPIFNVVRYVGMSENPWERLKQHTYMANRKTHSNPRMHEWIKFLKTQNEIPIMKILKECTIYDVLQEELYFISKLIASGVDLFNIGKNDQAHDIIDLNKINCIIKKHKINKLLVSTYLGIGANCISRYLKGHRNVISLSNAKRLEDFILNYSSTQMSNML